MEPKSANSLITLTTDFGDASPYVAAMKGVILGVNPDVRILDLTHCIPAQDILHAAFFLKSSVPFFPQGVLHVVVVDPGVGTIRALLYIDVGGHKLLAPDNGCWTLLARDCLRPPSVIQLTESKFWRQPVSPTFHGRDILAPVAGNLSLGLNPRRLGPRVSHWVELDLPAPKPEKNGWKGTVVFVDGFGNLITNIPGDSLNANFGSTLTLSIGKKTYKLCRARTYGEAKKDQLIALVSSSGLLELAVNQGDAAKCLAARVGTEIKIR